MPISDDWLFDYPNTTMQHVDGVLSFDGGSAGLAAIGQYIIGETSGAIGKVIAVTGSAASGTYTLTNVDGLFEDNESIDLLSTLDFDAVTDANGGFRVGDRIDGNASASQVDVKAIEYNTDGLGGGTIFGDTFTATFTNNEQLDIGAPTARIQLDVADADGVGVDNDAVIDTALVNTTMAVPGTASLNDSVIIHYDTGTIAIPEQAIIEDASSGAIGLVEQVFGVLATGSVRVVDYDSTGGAWTDTNTLRADQALVYQNLVAGQVFNVGDVVVGATSGATGRVILDDTASTTLIFADESGTWMNAEDLEVDSVKKAEANGTNTVLNLAVLNLPDGIRTEQRSKGIAGGVEQGGIYDAADSLNIVRKMNSLYTFSQDTFDELAQMDDDEAMDAAFKGFAYSLVFSWRIEENTTRGGTNFLRQGALIDTTGAEVWANPQSLGAQNKVTDTAYLIDTTQTFRQPQLYVEQNNLKVRPWWLEGNIDVLLKVRTRSAPEFITPATAALGQLITGGDPAVAGGYAVFNREFYTSTYDATEVDGAAGVVNSVALSTGGDTASDRNPQGTHTFAYDNGSGATLLVGEEIELTTHVGNDNKVGLVVAQTGDGGATGTIEYVLKSGAQFGDDELLTARVSGKTLDVDETGGFDSTNDVVAGFSVDIAFVVVDIAADSSSSTIASGPFTPGEALTQAGSGATGRLVLANETTDILYIEVDAGSAAFAGDTNVITGADSGATWTPTATATYNSATEFNADLNNGEGAQPYSGSVSGNIAGGGAETMQNVYQYSKYVARHEEDTLVIQGPGTAGGDDEGTIGQFFRRLKDAYSEIKPGNPIGVFTGSMAFGQGWFLDTDFIAAADIRAFSVIDDNGVPRSPPNLQSLTIAGVANLWRVAAYRSEGVGSTVIRRNEFDVGVIGSGNNEAADTTVLVGANNRSVSPLPSDVPDSGVLRVLSPSGSNNSGNFIRMVYTSVDRVTNIFTLVDTIGTNLTNAGEASNPLTLDDNVHVVFIEEQSAGASVTNTVQYVADIELVFKARLKGFKPFRSTGTFLTTGFTGGVVQTDDTIVDLP